MFCQTQDPPEFSSPAPQPDLIYVGGDTDFLKKPLESLDELNLSDDIVKKLTDLHLWDNSPTGLTPLQRAAAPNILNGCDSIIVGVDLGTKTKLWRTLAYLLPIIQRLTPHSPLSQINSTKKNAGPGPQVLLICSSVSSALFFEKFLNNLLSTPSPPQFEIQVVYSGMLEIEAKLNSADILITNVSSAPEILIGGVGAREKCGSKGTVVLQKRLKFLILDEIDAYLSTDLWALNSILSVVTKVPKKVEDKKEEPPPTQLIVSGSKWSKELEAFHISFKEKRKKPIGLYIDSVGEIVKFSSIQWRVDFVEDEGERFKILKEVVNNHSPHKRVVIACSTMEKVKKIRQTCEETCEKEIEVISDDLMATSNNSGCSYLLSFDSDVETKHRLSHLWPCLPKFINGGWVREGDLVAHFLMTGKEPFFFNFYKFSQTLNSTIHPKLEALGSEMVAQALHQTPICRGVELWGFCNVGSSSICNFRHEFNETDFEPEGNAPCYGERQEKEFWFPPTPMNYPGGASSFRNSTPRLKISSPRPPSNGGFIYALKTTDNSFKRVKIIRKRGAMAAHMSSITINDDVDLVYLDNSGNRLRAKANELLCLPHEFSVWSPLSLRLILTNLRPPLGEPEYPPGNLESLQVVVDRHVASKLVKAEVVASRGETVWVREISVVYKKNGKITSQNQRLRPLLQKHHAGLENPAHEQLIIDSCRRVGGKYHGSHLIQWAHVEKSNAEALEVFPARIRLTYGFNPWRFYGVHQKFVKICHKLEDELNSWVEANFKEDQDIWESEARRLLEPGSVVTAKERQSGEWSRALILEKDEDVFEVFFVDYGESYGDFKREELFPIPLKFVSRLPFQAMEFVLSHVQPGSGACVWSEEEKEAFLDCIFSDGGGTTMDLAVTENVDVEDLSAPPPCRYYHAVALTKEGVELGSLLVQNGKAELVRDISNLVEALENALKTPTIDDDDDFVEELPEETVNLADLVNGAIHNENMGDEEDDFYQRFDVYLPDSGIGGGNMFSDVMAQLCALKMSAKPSTVETLPKKSELSTSSAPLPTRSGGGLLLPTLLWHQTTSHLILHVQLPDIRVYSLKIGVDSRSLVFRTENPPNYGFNLKLFGKVELQPEQELLTGQELKIKLKKRLTTSGPWIRLMYDKKLKFQWVREHPDFFTEVVDEEEQEEMIEEKFYFDFKNMNSHLLQNDEDYLPKFSKITYHQLGDSEEEDSDEEGEPSPFLEFDCD
ncbi:putative ATP-dependent RNA helicase TDRD12 [Orchesella cincta]|uniref:RNA helicase n=1 Tax=Orchesella cincta TaxID=48709 RepID=A0A1D2M6U0_ORCCI|nr:putative ATP-dependent RNA helicase TDRD12 [Orchesella cincta]